MPSARGERVVARNALPRSTLSKEAPAPRPVSAPSILVVDDDEAIRQAIAQLLEDEGYQVAQASDGVEALEMIESAESRLVVLLDVMMPRMGGLEVCKRLKADSRLRGSHAVILMSAWFHHSASSDTLADAFLSKPFDIEALLDLVAKLAREPPPQRWQSSRRGPPAP